MADILYLVDRLEELLSKGFRVPFTSNAVIDEEAFLDLIDQMRIAIPNEIRQAQRITQERDRIIAQAREEAERLLTQARGDAERMVSELQLFKEAERRARGIVVSAEQEADNIRGGADTYALGVLQDLRNELDRITRTVENGLEALAANRDLPANYALDDDGADAPPAESAAPLDSRRE